MTGLALHGQITARLDTDGRHEGRNLLELLLGELRKKFDFGELLDERHGYLPAGSMPASLTDVISPTSGPGQKTATGTTGAPVAPTKGSGVALRKNECRP